MPPEQADFHCIFCWSTAEEAEHVFSKPVTRQLIGVPDDTEITWKDGSSELWAGETGATTLDRLTIRAVCRACNNEWMQKLDNQVAGDLTRWTDRSSVRLGRDACDFST